MRISPHLCFDGQCRQAMLFYQQILGGRIQTMLSYGETPMGASLDSGSRERILHATLMLDGHELTGVDMLPGNYRRPQGFFVTLALSGTARAKAVFDALGAGGTVQVPFEKTFWSSGFGVLVDKFGIPGEINTDDVQPAAAPHAGLE